MTRIAYLDIIGGISGDMLISAMLDAGLSRDQLHTELEKIVPHDFRIEVSKTSRGAIKSTHTDFVPVDEVTNRMGWGDFDACIERSTLPNEDIDKTRSIFDLLKRAEAEAHGDPAGTSHLHELGTLDTLLDIAGAVIGLRLLGVQSLHASPLPASIGMSSSSHGKGASFAPATIAIIRDLQIPVRVSGHNQPVGESITPTGAAIVASLANFKPINMQISTVGYGAGTRENDTPPNVVGLWLGEATERASTIAEIAKSVGVEPESGSVLVETNLDDMTGEELGYAMQSLFEVGALDVWMTPVQMKKSRPGVVLSVICKRSELNRTAKTIFSHTTTLGVRIRELERLVAQRESVVVETRYGPVRVKTRSIGGTVTQAAPEYDDCAKLASEFGLPLRSVMEAAREAISKQSDDLGACRGEHD